MDKTAKRHILYLFLVLIFSKIALVALVALVPVENVAGLLGMERQSYDHNWRALNWTADNRSLTEKFGNTMDSRWYVRISKNGYVLLDEDKVYLQDRYTDNPGCIYNWLFMYPAFIRIFSFFADPMVSGLVVANLASFLAVALFYLLAREYVDAYSAFKASVLLSLYPYNLTSWISSYGEPLFLVFALLAWHFMRKDNLVLCGLSMMLASMTRFPGLLLFPGLTLLRLAYMPKPYSIDRGIKEAAILNVFALPMLYWMFVQVPSETGLNLLQITSACSGYAFLPFGGLAGATWFNLFFTYFALIGAYYLKDIDRRLMLYCVAFMAFHLSIISTGGSLGRYIGVVWPLFIYYGKKIDRMDVWFYSAMFLALAGLMIEFQANMITWI